MTTANLACHAAAAAYMSAKSPKAKADILAYVAAKAKASSRVRWERLHNAILAGDKARIAYYASTGDAKAEALKALRQPKAEPKPEPKPAPKAKRAAPKREDKHPMTPALDAVAKRAPKAPAPKTVSAPRQDNAPLDARMAELVAAAKAAGLSPAQMAAFVKVALA